MKVSIVFQGLNNYSIVILYKFIGKKKKIPSFKNTWGAN